MIEVSPGTSISFPAIASIIFFCFIFLIEEESRIEFWENKNDDKKKTNVIYLQIIEINAH
jgi:hypothetical protein